MFELTVSWSVCFNLFVVVVNRVFKEQVRRLLFITCVSVFNVSVWFDFLSRTRPESLYTNSSRPWSTRWRRARWTPSWRKPSTLWTTRGCWGTMWSTPCWLVHAVAAVLWHHEYNKLLIYSNSEKTLKASELAARPWIHYRISSV